MFVGERMKAKGVRERHANRKADCLRVTWP